MGATAATADAFTKARRVRWSLLVGLGFMTVSITEAPPAVPRQSLCEMRQHRKAWNQGQIHLQKNAEANASLGVK